MADLFAILESKFVGSFEDDPATPRQFASVESTGHRFPTELRNLLCVVNGFRFEPAAVFRGDEVFGFMSVGSIHDVLERNGDQIPRFLLPFAHSLHYIYASAAEDYVYSISGVGYPHPQIRIDPLDLSLAGFIREMKPGGEQR